MTCAHVVHVALKKMPGVENVDVSLNQGLAKVKLKSGNTLSIAQFWQTIRQNGYTPKDTTVSVRGDVVNAQGQMTLKISGTNQVLVLAADPKNNAAYKTLESQSRRNVIVQGQLTPLKDLKKPVPLRITHSE